MRHEKKFIRLRLRAFRCQGCSHTFLNFGYHFSNEYNSWNIVGNGSFRLIQHLGCKNRDNGINCQPISFWKYILDVLVN